MNVLKFIFSILWDFIKWIGIRVLGFSMLLVVGLIIAFVVEFMIWTICLVCGNNIILFLIGCFIWFAIVVSILKIIDGENPYYLFLDWKDKMRIEITHYFSLKWYKITK